LNLQAYRISVRTVTTRGDESLDQEAMLTIGKGKVERELLALIKKIFEIKPSIFVSQIQVLHLAT
jgi:hypothetical protein